MLDRKILFLGIILLLSAVGIYSLEQFGGDYFKELAFKESQKKAEQWIENLQTLAPEDRIPFIESSAKEPSDDFYFELFNANGKHIAWHLPEDHLGLFEVKGQITDPSLPVRLQGIQGSVYLTDNNYTYLKIQQFLPILFQCLLLSIFCLLLYLLRTAQASQNVKWMGLLFLGLIILLLFYSGLLVQGNILILLAIWGITLGLWCRDIHQIKWNISHPGIKSLLCYFIGSVLLITFYRIVQYVFTDPTVAQAIYKEDILRVGLAWRGVVSLLIGSACSILLYSFTKTARTEQLSNLSRLTWIAIAILLTWPLKMWIIPDLPLLFFICLHLLSFLLIDLFIDHVQLNFTWLLSWICTLAGIIVLVLNTTITASLINSLEHEISNVSYDSPAGLDIKENIFQELLSGELKSVVLPPYPFTVNNKAVASRLNFALSGSPDKYSYDVYLTDSRGYYLSEENDGYLNTALHQINQLQGAFITPDGKPVHYYQKKVNVDDHPYNPIAIHVMQKQTAVALATDFIKPIPTVKNLPLLRSQNQSLYNKEIDHIKKIQLGPLETYFISTPLSLRPSFSLFSLLLFSGILIIVLIPVFNRLIFLLPTDVLTLLYNRNTLRYKIQLIVLSSIVISFIAIALLTIFYLKNTLNNQQEINWSAFQQDVKQSIAEGKEVSALSIENSLRAYNLSTQVDEYILVDHHLLSDPTKMVDYNYTLQDITRWDGNMYSTHTIIPLSFQNKSILVRLKDQGSNIQAILARFSATLLNVYMFLFIFSASLSIGLSNSITRPLEILAQNVRRLKLGKSQKPINTTTNDEIGTLISDYNSTVRKLEDSAKLIAITEREGAFREMAKQIAHEIKNPLTPMKLNIQHLEYMSKNADNDALKGMVKNVSHTLLEQIESLAKIATEFSTFAKFPQPDNQRVVLNEVIATAHDLFRKRDDILINLYVPIDDIYVFADKSFLLRVFNNLLKNAIQAIPKDRKGFIDIHLVTEDQKAVVSIRDNGSGISPEMQEKVFLPNFTTKSSGTGLGLAISTNIIESVGGRIYFETVLNKGTTFFVELPVLQEEREQHL